MAAGHSATDPQAAFAALEQRLLTSRRLAVEFATTSTAALESNLAGVLRSASDNVIELAFQGDFAGNSYEIAFTSDGTNMEATRAEGPGFHRETPAALSQAILLGFTRMGILHNLAQLISGSPPDVPDVGVDEWVRGTHFTAAGTRDVDGRPARGIGFHIEVNGTPSGEVTLWLDAATGLPVLRQQTVHFPSGDMQVVEQYRGFTVAP